MTTTEARPAVGGTGDIAIGAAGGAAVVVLCVVAARLYGQRRWQRIVWTFKLSAKERPKIILETIKGEKTPLYKRPTAGFGAVAAVAQLSTALNVSRGGLVRRVSRSLEHPIELSFSTEERADRWCSTADTVVIGGPKSNQITRAVLLAFGCQPPGPEPVDADERERLDKELKRLTEHLVSSASGPARGLGVATQGNAIYWYGERYEGDVGVAEDSVPGTPAYNGHDYGVVLRLPSYTRPSRRMVIVFGSQTFGVDAAALWLVQQYSRKTTSGVHRSMARHPNTAVLVKAEVKDGALGQLELIQHVELPHDLKLR
jgi:hypothetical protein